MKLKNKKTGEIITANELDMFTDVLYLKMSRSGSYATEEYPSIKAFTEEWEDYKEPKDIWWLDNEGCVNHASGDVNDSFRKNRKIGNYFLSREEAEKAVEKLKAWKRLKDKGLKVTEWSHGLYLDKTIVGRFRYEFPIDNKDDIEKDLDLLFGGEE